MPQEEMDHLPGNSRHSGKEESKTSKRINWKQRAQKLEKELAEMAEQCQELTYSLEHQPTLEIREASKLRRLDHIVGRLVNAPFCDHCRKWYDKLYEEDIKHTRETNVPKKAMGG